MIGGRKRINKGDRMALLRQIHGKTGTGRTGTRHKNGAQASSDKSGRGHAQGSRVLHG